jgi:hypothetical protein
LELLGFIKFQNLGHDMLPPPFLQTLPSAIVRRGPGDIIGKQQSGKEGLASLNATDLKTDTIIMEQARETAAEMIKTYGLCPADWPPAILARLSRTQSLPKLEDAQVPTTLTPV